MTKTQKCLLIIDMQKASFTEENPRYDASAVIKRINTVSKAFRKNALPVIFVQHNGDEYIPDTVAWELLDELHVEPTDIFIEKVANDTFYNSGLDSRLKALMVTDLVITGCATDFCIESTVQSALVKDYNVLVVEDAHTTDDKLHLSAEKIIEHHNWVWKNLTPTRGDIKVEKCETLLASLL